MGALPKRASNKARKDLRTASHVRGAERKKANKAKHDEHRKLCESLRGNGEMTADEKARVKRSAKREPLRKAHAEWMKSLTPRIASINSNSKLSESEKNVEIGALTSLAAWHASKLYREARNQMAQAEVNKNFSE